MKLGKCLGNHSPIYVLKYVFSFFVEYFKANIRYCICSTSYYPLDIMNH